jgi:hypothetical protein
VSYDVYTKVEGEWHTQPEGVLTGCGIPIPFGSEWTNHAAPTDDLCGKCFKRGEPVPLVVPPKPPKFSEGVATPQLDAPVGGPLQEPDPAPAAPAADAQSEAVVAPPAAPKRTAKAAAPKATAKTKAATAKNAPASKATTKAAPKVE